MSERTREPGGTVSSREGRVSSSGKGQAAKKRTAEKAGSDRRPVPPSEKKRTSAGQSTGGAVKKKKPAGAGDRRKPAAKRTGAASRKRTKAPADRSGRTYDRRMEEDDRMTSRELERARRRQERLRRVRRQKIIMAASASVIVLSLLTLLIFFLSPARCIVSLSKGDRYAGEEQYDEALAAYQEALEANGNSVRAYRGIAGCLRMKGQTAEAEQILYTGWEKTGDEGILRYYHKLLINESVEEINAGNCTQATADRLREVLREDPDNPEVLSLLDICNQRLSGEEPQAAQ